MWGSVAVTSEGRRKKKEEEEWVFYFSALEKKEERHYTDYAETAGAGAGMRSRLGGASDGAERSRRAH